jgi:GNAT superfamily N-acetyltransferase
MAETIFTHQVATESDIPLIVELMRASIAENMKAFLSTEEIIAAQETMGLDQSLIRDRTYFVIEAKEDGAPVIVACGGWGKRRTLYGGDHTAGRDDALADPSIHAARIRAMYTHPDWTRRGIGSLLLDLGEGAARDAGFRTIELGSTVPGYPLYMARGYAEFHREEQVAANGQVKTVIHMRKVL